MKKMLFAAFLVLSPIFAHADATTTVIHANVNVRYQNDLVWSGQVTLAKDATTTVIDDAGASHSIASDSALAALAAADASSTDFSVSDLAYYASYNSYLVNCIDISASSTHACYDWQYVVDSTYPSVGSSDYKLSDNDTLYFYFGSPRRFSVSATSTYATIPVSVHAESYDYTNDSWGPLAGATVGATQPDPGNPYSPLVPFSATTDANGVAQLRVNDPGAYNVGLASDFYYPTDALSVLATTTDDVVFRLRDGANVAYEGVLPLPAAGTTTIQDSTGASHDISARSALNLLALADATTTAFDVSDLSYYPSYGSFYVKCIKALSVDECDNWQYAVDGVTPGTGADSYDVQGGDEVYFYFASPQRISLATSSITTGASVTATAESYRASDNSYHPLADIVLGLARGSVIVSTSTADASGQAIFAPTATGTYDIGIYNDSSYGAFVYPKASLTVTEAAPGPVTSGSGGGGGSSSSGGNNSSASVDAAKALAFLVSKQRADGSFGASLYSDWASIALAGASGDDAARRSAADYLENSHVSGHIATDYERRAMALMALGISPYDGTDVDYIAKIAGFFDGTQIGDSGLVNDDIFAIFPLVNAGYSTSDDIVKKTVAFILSRQSADGSWESVDLTAAAIQALRLAGSLPGVSGAISSAENYLRSVQGSDGGFGDVSSTSWAAQAIAALGESNASWTKSGRTPIDALSAAQSSDGGFGTGESDDSRVWQTSYALPAAYGRTWDSIMAHFNRPVSPAPASGGSSSVVVPLAPDAVTVVPLEVSVRMDVSLADFIKRYAEALKGKAPAPIAAAPAPKKAVKAKAVGPQGFDLSILGKKSQQASVIGATLVGTSTPRVSGWFAPLFKFFGL